MQKKEPELSRKQFKKICEYSVHYHFCYCYLCGKPILENQRWNLDHIHPRSKGGKTIPVNLRPVHYYCNQSKADMILEDYIAAQKSSKTR